MSPLRFCPIAVLFTTLVFTAPAQASVPHTVQPGETLWSIAAASNFTNRALAAANGLPENAQVIAGSTIQIPSEGEAAAALAGAAPVAQPSGATAAPASTGAPSPMGAYTVRPGDTLSGIAAGSGTSVDRLAWMNGIDSSAPLLIGTALKLPTGAPLTSQAPAAPAAPAVVPAAEPFATPGRVTAEQIAGVASGHGVPPALAAAVAWQESGFNNGLVSSANARGVMQILPGTWTWVEDQLAGGPIDPSSPMENVRAGVLYLGQLLRDTGGDRALAVASYYQGASSVGRIGLLPDTERYVANVLALQSRFGGP